MLKRSLFVFFALAHGYANVHGHAHGQSVSADTLTLQQVIERAVTASPDIVQAESSISNAQSAERVALGGYLPSLSVTTNYGLASANRLNPETNTLVNGSSDSYRAGANVGIDVFTGGRRGAEARRANAVTDAAEATLIERRFAVTLNATRAYFDVAKADELIAVSEARLKRAQEGQVAAERRLQVGSATRSDVLRAQLETTNARNALAIANAQYRTAAFALGRLVGADGPVYARPYTQTAPRALPHTDEELVRLAIEQAPFVSAADANVQSARAGTSVARAQYLPSLRLIGGYNWFNSNPTFNDGQLSWNMGLGISYPLFNGFTREDQVARAEASARNASATYADARRRARAELERVLSALRLAEEQVALNQQAVAVAQEDLRVQEARYQQGMSTILDRITSQVNLMDAERNEVAARYDYEIARAELAALIGRPL